MVDLGPVPWPPVPIVTERLVLRCTEHRDRTAFIDLCASPDVGRFLGGAPPRGELDRTVPGIPAARPGVFAVERDGVVLGMVSLSRRDPGRTGHVRAEAGELELGYMFLPAAWGRGYAAEASAAVLDWAARVFPGEPVLVCTRVSNAASVRLAERVGFVEVQRFQEDGVEHWLGVRSPPA